jgi:anti-sigma regulatory factor (Ser/Thr protein kinase)
MPKTLVAPSNLAPWRYPERGLARDGAPSMTAIAPPEPFRHEALLYEGVEDLVAQVVPLIRDAVAAGEPVMAAFTADRLALLRDALGDDAEEVTWVDMGGVGANPARIIPACRAFLAAHPGERVLGVGEPVHPARGAEETVECQLHEALVNLAFGDADGLRLVCPYDASALDPGVLHEAQCSHPVVLEGGAAAPSPSFRGSASALAAFETPLPPPPSTAHALSFGPESLGEVRAFVAAAAERAQLDEAGLRNLVLAAHEVAANSLRHGGGLGVLRVWSDGAALVAEIRDRGRIRDPLAGRHAPVPDQLGGWGLWIANQACDLVQLRHEPDGSVVRLTVRRRG